MTTPPPARIRVIGPATFTYAAGTSSYSIISEARISASGASTAGQPLSLTEEARVSLTLQSQANYLLIAGVIESLTQNPSGDSTLFAIPASFADTLWATESAAAEPGLDPLCGRSSLPPRHLMAFLPTIPRELQQGERWERSYIYSICQGPIPLRVERTDAYLVRGAAPDAGPAGVAIARTSSLRLAGRGVEGQHNVRIDGSGSAEAVFHLDAAAGHLVRGTEESTSDIAITASGRTQRFRQQVTRRINRL